MCVCVCRGKEEEERNGYSLCYENTSSKKLRSMALLVHVSTSNIARDVRRAHAPSYTQTVEDYLWFAHGKWRHYGDNVWHRKRNTQIIETERGTMEDRGKGKPCAATAERERQQQQKHEERERERET